MPIARLISQFGDPLGAGCPQLLQSMFLFGSVTMKITKALLTTTLSFGLLAATGASQAAGWCESGKPVKFAGLNWESGMLLTDVMQFVLKNGYG